MSPDPIHSVPPSAAEARAATAPIPASGRTALVKLLAATARRGDDADALLRRSLLVLDGRILAAQRRGRDDRAAEFVSDILETYPDACRVAAAWVLGWVKGAAA